MDPEFKFSDFYSDKAVFINSLVFVSHNRMVLLKENTNICQVLLEHSDFNQTYLFNSGVNVFRMQLI